MVMNSYICHAIVEQMKRIILYTLFLWIVVFLTSATMQDCMPVAEPQVTTEELSETTTEGLEIVSVLKVANQAADLSLQQNTNTNNTVRRYKMLLPMPDSVFERTTVEGCVASDNCSGILSFGSRDYFARQKEAGYYLYTLCRLII